MNIATKVKIDSRCSTIKLIQYQKVLSNVSEKNNKIKATTIILQVQN